MALESVVRPFGSRSLYSDKRIATTPADPKGGTAHLCWGTVGTKPVPIPQGTSVETNDCNETNGELKGRDSVTHRIENPDDTSQYIMVRRPKVIYFKHTDSKKSSWAAMSDVAADVQAWQQDLSADLGINTDEGKCKMKMTLNAPDDSDTN
jgi:hypothetical protein